MKVDIVKFQENLPRNPKIGLHRKEYRTFYMNTKVSFIIWQR